MGRELSCVILSDKLHLVVKLDIHFFFSHQSKQKHYIQLGIEYYSILGYTKSRLNITMYWDILIYS